MARKSASEAKTTGKKTSKAASAKSSTRGRKKREPSKLLKSLPESVENIEIVQQVAGILEEMQSRVKDVKIEASKELKKLMKLYEGNYKNLEKKVHTVTSEAKKQAQVSMLHIMQKWHEHKEKIPAPVAKEVEKIVAQLGTRAMAKKKAKPAPEKPAKVTRKAAVKPRQGAKKRAPTKPVASENDA